MAKILIAEDDTVFGTMVKELMIHLHHSAELVSKGDEAWHRLTTYQYDAIILDWDLPIKSGIDICKEFRSKGGQAPVLMLTGKTTVDDKAAGLYGGADDYLTKPVDVKELSARVTALLRRTPAYTPPTLQLGELTLDAQSHAVTAAGAPVTLMPKEFALLELLMKHPNELLSNDALLERVWSSESETTSSVIRAHVHNLRKKLGGISNPVISTVHGLGYRLDLK